MLKPNSSVILLQSLMANFPSVRPNPETPVSSLCPTLGQGGELSWAEQMEKTITTVDIDNVARILNSGSLYLLHIQSGLAPGAGLRFVHPRLPSIVAFGTFHQFHINTVVIRVLITFDCI